MKWINYTKYTPEDLDIDAEDLMKALADYLLGSGFDNPLALVIHPTPGDIYVAGRTTSTNFPGTTGGAQPANASSGGGVDAFVARLTSSLALAEAAAVPTLSEWTQISMVGLLVAGGLWVLRRRRLGSVA